MGTTSRQSEPDDPIVQHVRDVDQPVRVRLKRPGMAELVEGIAQRSPLAALHVVRSNDPVVHRVRDENAPRGINGNS